MGIERMTFLEFRGGMDHLDEVLERCLHSGVFQPEYASKLGEYSTGASPLERNPYGALITRIQETAYSLDIALENGEWKRQEPHSSSRQSLLKEADRFLDHLAAEHQYIGEDRRELARQATDLEHGQDERLKRLGEEDAKLGDRLREQGDELSQIYAQARFYHDAYELRRYAVTMRDSFCVIGFVPTRQKEALLSLFEDLPDVEILQDVTHDESRVPTPVRLRNGFFARPFQMFVEMYGSPSYNDIDPTPFVAYTYCLLFGMMFGDLGQGLCICLLGLFLSKAKGMPLGGIMSRIGISSMVFGTVYGSVFGFEELLDPLYHAMGFHEKPIEVMRPETTNLILITAVGLGAAIILMVILFNICVGIKHRDMGRVFLSQNGVAGLVFYGAALFAAVMQVGGSPVLTTPYVLLLLVLPLLLIFFREPILRFAGLRTNDVILHSHKTLKESAEFKHLDVNLAQLFTSEFISARFGRIPTDSYEKLVFYENEPFVLYPLKSDSRYIWCIYVMAAVDKESVNAIFNDLLFERIYIPAESLVNSQAAEEFIRSCITGRAPGVPVLSPETSEPAGLLRKLFPEGIGGFIIENFFELFEVLLSFVTNTMSFLRVGGFILSHAGMMSVVMTLSAMVGAGASPIVIIVGNLFVMGLEGLIVGIQALRLEFYEMFSRFYDADGTPFTPVQADSSARTGEVKAA